MTVRVGPVIDGVRIVVYYDCKQNATHRTQFQKLSHSINPESAIMAVFIHVLGAYFVPLLICECHTL